MSIGKMIFFLFSSLGVPRERLGRREKDLGEISISPMRNDIILEFLPTQQLVLQALIFLVFFYIGDFH